MLPDPRLITNWIVNRTCFSRPAACSGERIIDRGQAARASGQVGQQAVRLELEALRLGSSPARNRRVGRAPARARGTRGGTEQAAGRARHVDPSARYRSFKIRARFDVEADVPSRKNAGTSHVPPAGKIDQVGSRIASFSEIVCATPSLTRRSAPVSVRPSTVPAHT